MKRVFLLLLAVASFGAAAAQCSATFDFGTALWGTSPDASNGEQFDTAYVDVAYSDVFHLLVPVDASVIDPEFTLPLDSMILVNTILIGDSGEGEMLNFADVGLEIQCNNGGVSSNPCTFIGGEQYCAKLAGTPTTAGVYAMSIEMEAWVTVFGVAIPQAYFFEGYVLTIVGGSSSNELGCMDPTACNYSPEAVEDDGSCAEYDNCGVCGGDGTECIGCPDESACNYSELATIDDGSCYYPPAGGPCDCGDGFTLSATLSGADTMSTTMTGSGYVSSLAVTLDFTYFSDDSYASEVILFIESPFGQCIEIGGYDNSFGCPDIYSWPADWSVPIGGQYTATINLLEPIVGVGTWTLGIGNGWEWSVNAGYVLDVTPDLFCEFDVVDGCMDVNACNFDGSASVEANELCTYPGCGDSEAINYDAAAGCEGDCVYLTYDCASIGDESWSSESMGVFPNWQTAMYGIDWVGEWVFNVPASVIEPSSGVFYDVHHVGGLTVSEAPEWLTLEAPTGSLSPSSQYCISASGVPSAVGANTLYLSGEVFISIFGEPYSIGLQTFSAVLEVSENPNPIPGCTYVTALNFMAIATVDDGSCQFAGCTDPTSLNFTPLATVDDGSCAEECDYEPSSSCASDSNGDGVVTVSDLLILLGEFGADCL